MTKQEYIEQPGSAYADEAALPPPPMHRIATNATNHESILDEAIDAEARADGPQIAIGGGEKGSDPGPPPNGGFVAWLQVAGSFFLFFNCWGTVNTFGVFQTYYENNPHWTESPSNISWIGSVQAFLLLLVGVFTGPIYDAGYFRYLIITGAILIPLGFQMTSLCHAYWQTMLAQGITIGLGSACIFVPSVAILPQYFTTKKALANGIAAAGSSVGGVVYPIVFRELLPQIGFGWATRVLGFMSLATLWFSVFTMKPRYLPQGRRKMFDWAAFREIPYLCFSLGMVFAFIGFYGPIYYIQSYALAKHITTSNLAFYLLPMLNAASVFGRVFPNFIADYIGPLNVLIPCALITGVLAFYWIGVTNLAGAVLFALLYGFFSGGFVSLPAVAITTLTDDMEKLGTRLGQCFFVSAFGLLCGTPVSGAILDSSGGWLGVQLFSGFSILLATAFMVTARVSRQGWSLKTRT
ncbi:hypothetical protein DV735_g5968, partial [Chaetothyriales sp. CBS 134920]